MKTVLLTGTRAPATLDLARRLRRDGLRVVGADPTRFPLGRWSRAFSAHHRVPPPVVDPDGFLAAILTIIEKERVDLLWPTCEEIFHLAAAHDRLAGSVRMLCDPLAALLPLHDKLAFARFAGTLAPDSWEAKEAPRGRRLVWKPRFSRFAARVRFDDPPPDPRGWMAQDFVEGDEFSSWALCLGGEVRTLTVYQCPVRAGRGAGCAFVPFWDEEAATAVRDWAAQLGTTGSLAFDWIRSRDGSLRVIECNPRLTSGLHVLDPSVSLAALLEGPAPLPPPMRAGQLLWPTVFQSLRLGGTTPDLVFARDDPWPALGQVPSFLELAVAALRHRISLSAAATRDIEWNGP
jgi:hypothetical protein